MNAVLGFAQLLESDSSQNLADSQTSFVAEVLRSGKHKMELIDGILDLAKIEDGKSSVVLEDIAISELVAQRVTMVNSTARQQNILVRDGVSDTKLPRVRIDRLSFQQSLPNLLSNAVKYNHEGGEVNIDAAVHGDTTLRINVRNTGPEIPESGFDKVFEPFERLGAEASAIPGTGSRGRPCSHQVVDRKYERCDRFRQQTGKWCDFLSGSPPGNGYERSFVVSPVLTPRTY
jgi:signal transduction histidine kinase